MLASLPSQDVGPSHVLAARIHDGQLVTHSVDFGRAGEDSQRLVGVHIPEGAVDAVLERLAGPPVISLDSDDELSEQQQQQQQPYQQQLFQQQAAMQPFQQQQWQQAAPPALPNHLWQAPSLLQQQQPQYVQQPYNTVDLT